MKKSGTACVLSSFVRQSEGAMLCAVESVVLFVPDLQEAVAWYSTVLGAGPTVLLDRTAAFNLGAEPDLVLVHNDGQRQPGCAALVCDDLDGAVAPWRELAGVVHAELMGRGWPVRAVILSDPGGNFLVVLERAAPNELLRPTGPAIVPSQDSPSPGAAPGG